MNTKLIKKTCIALLPAVSIFLSLPAHSKPKRIRQPLVLDGKVRNVLYTGYVGLNLRPRRIHLPRKGDVYNGLDKVKSFIAEPGELKIQGYLYPYESKTNTPYANHTDPTIINVHILYGRNFKCSFVLNKPQQQNRRCIIPSRQRVYLGAWMKRVKQPVIHPLGLRDVVIISGPAAKNIHKTTYPEYRAGELASLRAGGDRLSGGTGNKCVGSAFNGC